MHNHRETNPHFLPTQLPTPQPPPGTTFSPPPPRRQSRTRPPPPPTPPARHRDSYDTLTPEPPAGPPHPRRHSRTRSPPPPPARHPEYSDTLTPEPPTGSSHPRRHSRARPPPPLLIPPAGHPDSSRAPTPGHSTPPLPPSLVPQGRPGQSKHENDYIDNFTPKQRAPTPPPPRPPPPPHHHHPSLRMPSRTKTNPLTWAIAACCALFWIIVIIALLAILTIYLVFRPRVPKFDISSATINAAYLDLGYLLNSDLTILANFTNPNKKGRVEFKYAIVDLYHGRTQIASTYIHPFAMMNHEYKFQEVHLVSSQVALSPEHSQQLRNQIETGRVRFEVKGLFRAKSDLGGFLKYSYWLYGHCSIMVTSPPTGTLIAKKCTTKR